MWGRVFKLDKSGIGREYEVQWPKYNLPLGRGRSHEVWRSTVSSLIWVSIVCVEKLQKLCRNCDQFRFSCTDVKYNIASMYGVAKATCQTRMVAIVLKLRCTGSLIPKLHFGKGYTISVGALGEIS